MTAIDTADGNFEGKRAHALMFRNADTEIGGEMGPRAVCGEVGAHWTAVLLRYATEAEYAEQVCRACMFLLEGGLHITVDDAGQCWPAEHHASVPAALAAVKAAPARGVAAVDSRLIIVPQADDRPPVLSVPHADDCGVWLGHYSCATWSRCTCRPPVGLHADWQAGGGWAERPPAPAESPVHATAGAPGWFSTGLDTAFGADA